MPQGVIIINFSKSLWVGHLSDSSDTETAFFCLFFYMFSVSSGHLNSVVHRLKGHVMSPQIQALSWLAEQQLVFLLNALDNSTANESRVAGGARCSQLSASSDTHTHSF